MVVVAGRQGEEEEEEAFLPVRFSKNLARPWIGMGGAEPWLGPWRGTCPASPTLLRESP